jgi:hypothetical protein
MLCNKLFIARSTNVSARGRPSQSLTISRRIYRLLQTDVFYIESESTYNVYIFLKFKPDIIEWCSCSDNSLRGGGQMRWKHLHAIEFVIRLGTLRDIEKLPTEAKFRQAVITKATAIVVPTAKLSITYKDDDYSF